jgi:hypothetical protein
MIELRSDAIRQARALRRSLGVEAISCPMERHPA